MLLRESWYKEGHCAVLSLNDSAENKLMSLWIQAGMIMLTVLYVGGRWISLPNYLHVHICRLHSNPKINEQNVDYEKTDTI